ncbi:unnamed protein product [Caenorhabditis brenneri]
MDYLKPVLGTTSFYPINVNSIIPDGIVRERRQFFVSNDLNMTNDNGDIQKFEGYTHKSALDYYAPGTNKNKIYPIVNTRTPMRPAIVYYGSEDSDQRSRNHTPKNEKTHPYFVVKVRSHPPYQDTGQDQWVRNRRNVDYDQFANAKRPMNYYQNGNSIDSPYKSWNDMDHNSRNFEKMSITSSRRASDDHSSTMSGSSEIMSMHDQIVRFSANSSPPDDTHTNSLLAEKEATLVVRLEQELTQAQICNHRLNQQLKVLANSSDKAIKVELANTKKQLKERVNDVEQLKKQVSKYNTERAMWLSKQPQDVNALLAEKQELRKQLDREQSEKQELFMQINSMIAKLADSGDQDEINRLKSDVNSLKRELEAEKIAANAEAARLKSELQKARSEIQNSINDGDKEKEAMEQEIENLQRQLNIKTASLQSLMLAKSDTNKTDKLTEENESLKLKVEDLQKQVSGFMAQIQEKNSEIAKMKDAVSVGDVTRQNMETLSEKLSDMDRTLKEEQQQKIQLRNQTETLKNALSASEETLSKLKVKLATFEESALEMKSDNDRLKMSQREATLFDSGRIKELQQALSDEKDNNAILNVQLREKDGKIDRIQVDLLAAESRAQQAEEDAKEMKERILKGKKNDDSNQLLQDELRKTEEKYQQAQKKIENFEATIRKQESQIVELGAALNESKMQLEKLEEQRRNEENVSKEEIKKLKSQVIQSEQEIEAQKKRVQEMAEDRKVLESKASVADEISTLMSSLNSLREENRQYEEEIRSLQNEMRSLQDEVYTQQDTASEWKNRAEKAEEDLEKQNHRVRDVENSHDAEITRLENEKKLLEDHLEKAEQEKEQASREASESVRIIKRDMTEATINSDRQIQTLKEKTDSLTRELESSRRRMEQLQEDQTKFVGSHDEIKAQMMKDLHETQEGMEILNIEIGQLKLKNETLQSEFEESEHLNERLKVQLEKADKKIEETETQLHAAEELADRLQEAQILSGNVESKFSDLQKENKIEMENITENHKKELEKLKEELKKSHTEHTSLESVLEEQQKELALLQDQLRDEKEQSSSFLALNQRLEKSEKEREELEEKLKEHVSKNSNTSKSIHDLEEKLAELVKTNDLLVVDVQKLSDALDSKSKQLQEAESQVRKAQEEIQTLRNAEPTENPEMTELTTENARLAGELLKFHSAAEKSLQQEKEKISKQFEERLKTANLEKTRLASELQMAESKRTALEKQVDQLQSQVETAERRRRVDIHQLEGLREELDQVKNDNEKLKSSTPVAPPRSNTRTISNMSAMTNWTQADFSDCEDLTRLRTEIDKQKRLIIVLRRKLQGLQQ